MGLGRGLRLKKKKKERGIWEFLRKKERKEKTEIW